MTIYTHHLRSFLQKKYYGKFLGEIFNEKKLVNRNKFKFFVTKSGLLSYYPPTLNSWPKHSASFITFLHIIICNNILVNEYFKSLSCQLCIKLGVKKQCFIFRDTEKENVVTHHQNGVNAFYFASIWRQRLIAHVPHQTQKAFHCQGT